MKHGRIICLGLWLAMTLVTPAHAEMAAPLAQEVARLSGANATQRQALTGEIDNALRLGVSEQDVSKLVSLAATQNYTASDVVQFVQKLTSLQLKELPNTLVRDKILEGMAKRVPAAAILQVASNWTTALGEAKTVLRDMEQKGLTASPAERTALINMGATLQQRYGAPQALHALSQAALESGRIKRSAASISAAAELTETLLLSGAKSDQAVSLPGASLRADFSPQRILGLQRSVLDQLRQGIAITDIIASQQKQFGAAQNPARPSRSATALSRRPPLRSRSPRSYPCSRPAHGSRQSSWMQRARSPRRHSPLRTGCHSNRAEGRKRDAGFVSQNPPPTPRETAKPPELRCSHKRPPRSRRWHRPAADAPPLAAACR